MLKRSDIRQVLKILREEYRDTGTALNYLTPFQLLISTILSAQSTDRQVNLITRDLYHAYPDADSLLKLTLEELEEKIKSIGLYHSKARNILATCQMLGDEFDGKVPETLPELMRLPGVGRKTANVVLSVGFRHDAIAVDTHVFRVSNRIGLADAATVSRTEAQLMENIPRKEWSAAHHWLIWHGRRVCKAQNPGCITCRINRYCLYYKNLPTLNQESK